LPARRFREKNGKPRAPFARATALPAEARATRPGLEQRGIVRHPAIPRLNGKRRSKMKYRRGGLPMVTELTQKSGARFSFPPAFRLLRFIGFSA
jgi:hypothetical protein